VSEARWVRERMVENATREPGPPAEADRCVVKRPVPRSPFPGSQAMARERGESLEETPGTREARVLVVKAVRSRSRLERIELGLSALPQGRPREGDLALRKPPYPLTRKTGAHLHRMSREGRSSSRLDSVRAWPQRRRGSPASERNGAQAECRNIPGRHDVSFCSAPLGVGSGRLKCVRGCGGGQDFRHDGRCLESFPHLLVA